MKTLTVLSLIVVLSLVLAACSPAASTPAAEMPEATQGIPVTAPTAALPPTEVATEAPTEAATEMPTEALPAEPTPAEPTEAPMEASQTIVDIAAADGRFTTLVAAVQAAGLEETLQGEGPFTVFAPTDDAFAALPEGTVESLLEDPEGDLKNILLYHVVPGKVMAADVIELSSAETALGEELQVRVEGDQVFINDAQVIIADIEASNGVIHVIDSVLLPPS
jgi:uncharacterized surface protein with fasciclin (FAS1) repeats